MSKTRTGAAALALAGVYVALVVGFLYLVSGPGAIRTFFHWPDGSIWSNLLASAVLAAGYIWHQAVAHQELIEQGRRHHDEQLKLAHDHHAANLLLHTELRGHINTVVGGSDTVPDSTRARRSPRPPREPR